MWEKNKKYFTKLVNTPDDTIRNVNLLYVEDYFAKSEQQHFWLHVENTTRTLAVLTSDLPWFSQSVQMNNLSD
jgi:hypothetical protein